MCAPLLELNDIGAKGLTKSSSSFWILPVSVEEHATFSVVSVSFCAISGIGALTEIGDSVFAGAATCVAEMGSGRDIKAFTKSASSSISMN